MEQEQSYIHEIDAAGFAQAVLQRSREVPIVVDFWAPWCGPCKTLGPLLERVTTEHGGVFELVKINTDENQELAGELGIQSIPTVIAFRHGTPVARFSGAIPEQALRQWIADLLPTEIDGKLDDARTKIIEGDEVGASALLAEILAEVPDHEEAGTAMASIMISRGDVDDALILLGKLVPSAEVERLMGAARVAASKGSDLSILEATIAADPSNSRARLDLAQALAARGEYEPALDEMLRLVREKDPLKDDARSAMIDIFAVLGTTHPLTVTYRRQLTSALF